MSREAECTLIRGPQDGAKVTYGSDEGLAGMPLTLFVGRKWLGDGYAAWSREASDRFPAEYARVPHSRLYFFQKFHAVEESP